MNHQEQDLTVGSVPQKLISFALPLFGANLLQSFYSIVDMLVVGRVVGKSGLAAIGNASMISFLINSICIGVTMGGTVLVAQYKGAHDEQGQKETVGTLFSLSLIASVIVTIAGLLLYSPLFSVLRVPAEAVKDACDFMLFDPAGTDVIKEGVLYLRICCSVNSLVYAVMYTLDSFAIGVGSANVAMCNALLDAVFVRLPGCWLLAFTLQMGFIGIYIGQAVSPILPAIVGLLYFMSKKWKSKKLLDHEFSGPINLH